MSPEPKGGGGGLGRVGGCFALHSLDHLPSHNKGERGTLHAAIILITTPVAVRSARNKVIHNVDVCN